MKACVRRGKIEFYSPTSGWLARFEGKEVDVEVSKWSSSRSTNQNRYLWGVAYPIIADIITDRFGERCDKDETHEMMRQKFLTKTREIGGKRVKIPLSTTKLSVDEMSTYIDNLKVFAKDFGQVILPDPV